MMKMHITVWAPMSRFHINHTLK